MRIAYRKKAAARKQRELAERLKSAGLPVRGIEALAAEARETATRTTPPRATGRVVAVSEYRDGCVTDLVRQIGNETT